MSEASNGHAKLKLLLITGFIGINKALMPSCTRKRDVNAVEQALAHIIQSATHSNLVVDRDI